MFHFLNHFKCFCDIKTNFPAKTNHRTLFHRFFITIYDMEKTDKLRHIENTHLNVKRFELKLGMCEEEGLLINFPKFHGDRATITMFSQCCRKTYRTGFVLKFYQGNKIVPK